MERSTPPELDPNLKGLADVLISVLVRQLLGEAAEETDSAPEVSDVAA